MINANLKKLRTLSLLCILYSFAISVQCTAQSADRYFIRLTHKNNTPYNLSNPQQFLTQRAIDRRLRQQIAIDSTDLPVDTSFVRQINACGATVLYTSRWFNAVVATVPNATVLSAINALPFVVNTNLVNRYKSDKANEKLTEMVSTEKNSNVNSTYNYGSSLNQIEMLNGVCMHDKGYDGRGIQIAVLDAGFANANIHTVFDSLRANNQILGVRDFSFNSPLDVYAASTSGHGTAVLSCMGGYKAGQLVGTAPKANYWLFRSEYAPTEYIVEEYNWVAAAECADSVGADIINSSLGYNTFDNSAYDHTMAQLDGKTSYASRAATICARKGMIVCNSAGNTGGSGWPKITFPSDADSILTVGAVDPSKNHAAFSSIGPSADGRVKPDVCAQGIAAVVATGGNSISTSNGTSFSSPITAGMVACLWQANPTKTNMQIIDAIRKSSSTYTNPNVQFGYGIPDYCAANDILKTNVDFSNTTLVLTSANPFVNEIEFLLTTKDSLSLDVKLYDLNGKLVFYDKQEVKAKNYSKIQIGTSNFAAGIYIMKIVGNTQGQEQVWKFNLLKVQN